MIYFDDFLGLGQIDFSRTRLVAFVGASGSGKSTLMRHLLAHHPDFRDLRAEWVERPPFDIAASRLPETDVLVVDEITRLRDLRSFALARAKKLVVASHVSALVLRALRPTARARCFRTDRGREKIERYLSHLGVSYSEEAVVRYVSAYGAVYTDVDIMLERHPGASFDVALDRFERFARIRRTAVA